LTRPTISTSFVYEIDGKGSGNMGSLIARGGIALAIGLLWVGIATPQLARGAYEFDPVLSLTGACGTGAPDTVADPGCPYPPPPDGPSGRFDEPLSIAIDAYGNEYVASYAENSFSEGSVKGRIDVFDDEGNFITEISSTYGAKSITVDSEGNLYAMEHVKGKPTQVVRYSPTVYKPLAREIKYDKPKEAVPVSEVLPGGLAIDISNDHLFVSTGGTTIREYSSTKEGNLLLATITHEKLKVANWVAVDADRRRLYASYCKNTIKECGVLVFEADAPHALLKEIDGSSVPNGEFRSEKGWTSIAVDEETGHFLIEDLAGTDNVYEFDADYEYVSTTAFTAFQPGNGIQIAISNSPLNPTAKNLRYLFVPVPVSAGRALAFKPPQIERAPKVLASSVTNISEEEAELQATIHPEGDQTTYVFEYVTQEAFDEEGFASALVTEEGEISATSGPTLVFGLVEGLVPGQAYRFRVIAKNLAGEAEGEGGFTTYSDAPSGPALCSNQVLRTGPSALLPDCRAFELVTPPDTNGRPLLGAGVEGDRFGMVNASPLGGAVSYEVVGGPLPGTEGTGGLHGDPYRATRSTSGWTTALIGPSGAESSQPVPGSISPDQGYSFWAAGGIGSAVVNENEARYVKYPDGHSEFIGRGTLGADVRARGRLITENGSHIIFQTVNLGGALAQQLEPNAPPAGTEAVYDRTRDSVTGEEVTHVVSLLPGNVTPAASEDATYLNASADGEGIAFEIAGTLYLRVGNAVTYEIDDSVTFAGVSEGGKRVFFVRGGDLFAFDTEANKEIAFSSVGNAIPVNVAPDGTRAYFVTTSVVPGGGQNPNGAFAKAGQQNLYLSEEGDITFVATVTARDVEGETVLSGVKRDGLGLWAEALVKSQPGAVPARVTPDGTVLAFHSRANLTRYDSEGVRQVYRYDDVADRLHCVSCIPTNTPAAGGASLQSFKPTTGAPFGRYGFVSNLRSDGKRLFFESTEALVSTDADEAQDVYEWEESGTGTCDRPGGCIYLISSGHSARDDFLFGVSSSGDDVFFATDDILVAGDSGTLSIYDARVDGGFAAAAPRICQEVDFCRGQASPPPSLPIPPSEALGPGASPRKPPFRCPKGKRKIKRKGKVRCVKKPRKHQQRKAGAKRGAAK
jgi:hypothetical protein